MTTSRDQFVRDAAARGKYAPLYRHLLSVRSPEREWRTTFGEIEAILGFRLPGSARRYRPWWSNSKKGNGHSHSLAWQAAGWQTRAVDLDAETLVFARSAGAGAQAGTADRKPAFDLDRDFPPWDAGPWPEGFTVSREQIHGDRGRLTGGPENATRDRDPGGRKPRHEDAGRVVPRSRRRGQEDSRHQRCHDDGGAWRAATADVQRQGLPAIRGESRAGGDRVGGVGSRTNETPALAAKLRVEAGLEALRVGLAPYIAKHMRDRHGPNWRHYASRAGRDETEGELDVYALLKTLLDQWNDLFRHDTKLRKARSFVSLALNARNSAAHFAGAMEAREALRYLDAMRELLAAVGATPQVETVEGLYEAELVANGG